MEGGVTITSALSTISSAASSVMTFITGNELMMVLFCSSIVGLAFSFIRKAKRTARA